MYECGGEVGRAGSGNNNTLARAGIDGVDYYWSRGGGVLCSNDTGPWGLVSHARETVASSGPVAPRPGVVVRGVRGPFGGTGRGGWIWEAREIREEPIGGIEDKRQSSLHDAVGTEEKKSCCDHVRVPVRCVRACVRTINTRCFLCGLMKEWNGSIRIVTSGFCANAWWFGSLVPCARACQSVHHHLTHRIVGGICLHFRVFQACCCYCCCWRLIIFDPLSLQCQVEYKPKGRLM